MRIDHRIALMVLAASTILPGQDKESKEKGPRPEDLPTSSLTSKPGPSFRVAQTEVGDHPSVITYGDQRFTDPTNTKVTNPRARKMLVNKIAEQHPTAILMNGDVPYSGDVVNDYEVYRSETEIWRSKHLHVYPALGNHEFHGDPQQALEHWWNAFPEMRNRRWYSVELGKSLYTIALDSDTSLAQGSDQLTWLNDQLKHLPKSTKFVFINLHHPPVADVQTRINVSHNPRPNEIVLRDDIESLAPTIKAKIVVIGGHIHNYERFLRGDVTYLVSGGGAASPVDVERTPDDLFQNKDFPNYHFVEFVLRGNSLSAKMYRLKDASAPIAEWEVRDNFEVNSR